MATTVIDQLASTIPSLTEQWAQYRTSFGAEDAPSAHAGELAQHVAQYLAEQRQQELAGFCTAYRKAYDAADQDTSVVLFEGFMESLVWAADSSGLDHDKVYKQLGPDMREFYKEAWEVIAGRSWSYQAGA